MRKVKIFKLILFQAAGLLLILFGGERTFSLAQVKEPAWYAANTWRQPQGLPQNYVTSLLRTSDGYLWVGTKAGLARFDGVSFTTFDDRDKNQLRDNEIWALVEADDSSLWIGTYGGGLSHYQNGKFTVYTTKDGLSNNFIKVLRKDNEGAIWIATDNGLSRFKDGQFTNYTVNDGLAKNSIRSLHVDQDGTLWIGSIGGINTFKDGKIYTKSFPGLTPDLNINSFYRDREQALWIGTNEALFRIKDGNSTRYTTKDGLSSDYSAQVHQDPAGNIWVITDRGLDRYKGGEDSAHQFVNEISLIDQMGPITSDDNGNVWIGTHDGLSRIYRGQFANYTSKDGLTNDNITAILQDKQNNIWIGTGHGVNRLRNGEITNYPIKDPLVSDRVAALAVDSQGNLWVGMVPGLYQLKYDPECSGKQCRGEFIPMINEAIPNMSAKIIFEDRDGAVWIGTNLDGLARYKDKQFTTYTTKDGLSNNAIRGICQDQDGSLWIGTRGGGLNRFKDGKFSVLTEKDGLANDNVQLLYMDRDNTLWIATRQGLNRYKDGKFTTYTVNDGLFTNFVTSFVEDNKGNLWMNSARGVFRVNKQQLNSFADGQVSSINSVAYGVEHGLSSTIGAVATTPGGYKTSDGKVWFGSIMGVNFIDPEKLSNNTLPPIVHIEEVSIDQKTFDVNQAAEALPGSGDIMFRYTGLSFIAPDKVHFKYKLEGFDKDWIDAGTRRVAYYTNLPPGNYTFRVMASNNDGVWNETGASFSLNLNAHFYQTYWFYALLAIGVTILGILLFRLRVKNLRDSNQKLESKVAERTAELQSAMNTSEKSQAELQLAMEGAQAAVRAKSEFLANMSHEIRTPMNGVIGMTGLLLDTPLDENQRDFAETIRSSGDALLTIINDILDFSKIEAGKLDFEAIDFDLGNVVDDTIELLAETAAGKNLEFASFIYPEVPTLLRGDPGRLRQVLTNLIGNALKFTEGGEVIVRVKNAGETDDAVIVRFEVCDTGIGISEAAQRKLFQAFSQADGSTTRKYGGTRLGLAISKQLVELMDGEIGVESEADKGSTFWFTAQLEKQPAETLPVMPEVLSLSGSRVLIVDDNATVRHLLLNQLRGRGMITDEADSGAQALELLRRAAVSGASYNMAILDLNMPGMDGFELARAIKSEAAISGVSLVVLTSFGLRGDGAAAREAHVAAYLTKPLRQTQLFDCLIKIAAQSTATEKVTPAKSGTRDASPELITRHTLNESRVMSQRLILVAEDNIVNQKIALRQLQKLGYRADAVANGREAVEAMELISYDLVLMDCQMPEMDGYAATAAIRRSEAVGGKHTLIVAMTANALQGDKEKCLAAGMDDYISKPVKLEELTALLDSLLTQEIIDKDGYSTTSFESSIPVDLKQWS